MEVSAEAIEAARAKLRERCSEAGKRIGGKGTARRKTKKLHKSTGGDDKKLNQAVKRIGCSSLPGIEEVQMYKDDGKVMVFSAPKVQAAPSANTYVVVGSYTESTRMQFSQQEIVALLEELKLNPNLAMKLEDPEVLKQFQKIQREAGAGAAATKPGTAASSPHGTAADGKEKTATKKKKGGSGQQRSDNHDNDNDDNDDDDEDEEIPDITEDFEDVSKQLD